MAWVGRHLKAFSHLPLDHVAPTWSYTLPKMSSSWKYNFWVEIAWKSPPLPCPANPNPWRYKTWAEIIPWSSQGQKFGEKKGRSVTLYKFLILRRWIYNYCLLAVLEFVKYCSKIEHLWVSGATLNLRQWVRNPDFTLSGSSNTNTGRLGCKKFLAQEKEYPPFSTSGSSNSRLVITQGGREGTQHPQINNQP